MPKRASSPDKRLRPTGDRGADGVRNPEAGDRLAHRRRDDVHDAPVAGLLHAGKHGLDQDLVVDQVRAKRVDERRRAVRPTIGPAGRAAGVVDEDVERSRGPESRPPRPPPPTSLSVKSATRNVWPSPGKIRANALEGRRVSREERHRGSARGQLDGGGAPDPLSAPADESPSSSKRVNVHRRRIPYAKPQRPRGQLAVVEARGLVEELQRSRGARRGIATCRPVLRPRGRPRPRPVQKGTGRRAIGSTTSTRLPWTRERRADGASSSARDAIVELVDRVRRDDPFGAACRIGASLSRPRRSVAVRRERTAGSTPPRRSPSREPSIPETAGRPRGLDRPRRSRGPGAAAQIHDAAQAAARRRGARARSRAR